MGTNITPSLLEIQSALGTEEKGAALVEVACNAHRAEQRYAALVTWIRSQLDWSNESTDFEKALLDWINKN